VGDAKTGISSLSLKRKPGVNYRTVWLLHNKIIQAMSEREESDVLQGKVQLDDAGHPIHVEVSKVATFSFAATCRCTARPERILRSAELAT
jgi:hypothetical protein